MALVACGQPSAKPTAEIDNLQPATVVRVVDGDTLVVRIDGREARVRYIGIDSPESVKPDSPEECFGTRASDENKRLVEGRTVYLERDVRDTDTFGRLLRYVFVDNPEGGARIFVNAELVRAGFAEARRFPPNVARQAELDAAEEEARLARRGMWSACDLSLFSQ